MLSYKNEMFRSLPCCVTLYTSIQNAEVYGFEGLSKNYAFCLVTIYIHDGVYIW